MDIKQALLLQQKPLALALHGDNGSPESDWNFTNAIVMAVNFLRATQATCKITHILVTHSNPPESTHPGIPDYKSIVTELLEALHVKNNDEELSCSVEAVNNCTFKITVTMN